MSGDRDAVSHGVRRRQSRWSRSTGHQRRCALPSWLAQRQAAKAGIGYEPLDNGFASCDDVPAVQALCDSLGPSQIDALLRKWLAILPHPFPPKDETAGYRYELSILQAEFSLTQMLDRPVAGRIFFEQLLHDNLDIGRPDQISLIFDRRIIRTGRSKTPGRFRTRVITNGVIPSLHIDYKRSKIKQGARDASATSWPGGPAHFVYPPLDGCCIYWAPSWPFDDDTVGEWVHAASMITLCAVLNDAIFDPFSTEPERLATPAPARTRTAQRELTGRAALPAEAVRSGPTNPAARSRTGTTPNPDPHGRSRRPG